MAGSPAPRGTRHRVVWLLALVVLAAGTALAADALTFPKLTGRVVDDAKVLSPDTEATLTRELAAFEQQSGGTQIVVATVPSLEGHTIETYGYQLGRHWGIGQRGKNTGALLIVAPAERKVRIEVGYGLEGELTDAVSSDIIQGRILPRFRQGDFDGGVRAGVHGMMAALGGQYRPTEAPQGERRDRRRAPAALFWIFVGLILLSSFGRRRRGGLGRALLLGGMLGGIGRGRPGGFGGGGFGGGGFSGGGGSFGGGGASGGW